MPVFRRIPSPQSLSLAKLAAIAALVVAIVVAVTEAPQRLYSATHWNPAHLTDDFGVFYSTAACLVAGCDPFPIQEGWSPNLNPPHAHLLMRPLLRFPRETAYWIWVLANALAIILSAWRMHASGIVRLRGSLWAMVGIAAATSGVALASLASGQIYGLLLWPLTEAWIAAHQERWRRAVMLLTVLATVKPLLLLLLAWIVWRRPAVWRVAIITSIVLLTAGVVWYGLPAYRAWIVSLSDARRSGHWWDGSILQALVRNVGVSPHFAPLLSAPALVTPIWLVLSAVLLLDLGRWARYAPINRAWLAVLAAAFLISPKGWLYGGWWMLGPGIALAVDETRRRTLLMLCGALLILPDTTPRAAHAEAWLTPLLGSLYCWTWLAIYYAARGGQPSEGLRL